MRFFFIISIILFFFNSKAQETPTDHTKDFILAQSINGKVFSHFYYLGEKKQKHTGNFIKSIAIAAGTSILISTIKILYTSINQNKVSIIKTAWPFASGIATNNIFITATFTIKHGHL
jgi:hypothetical protein